MEGVTVIAEHAVSDFNIAGVAWAVLLTMAVGLFLCIASEDGGCFTWVFSGALFILAAMCWVVVLCGANTSHTEYTVTINDTVSYNEFTETYEVISEEDGIYRVKLREDSIDEGGQK